MLREWLTGSALLDLPIAAMLLFLLMFLGVVWRVSARHRRATYRQMAELPLADDTVRRVCR